MVLVWATSDHRKHNHHHYHQLQFNAVSWFPICSRREHLKTSDLLQAGHPSCHPTNSVKHRMKLTALKPTTENHPPASYFLDPLLTPKARGVSSLILSQSTADSWGKGRFQPHTFLTHCWLLRQGAFPASSFLDPLLTPEARGVSSLILSQSTADSWGKGHFQPHLFLINCRSPEASSPLMLCLWQQHLQKKIFRDIWSRFLQAGYL